MKIHKIMKSEKNVIVGKTTRCGLSTFYTTKETETYFWKKVTCKRCLRLKNKKWINKWKELGKW